MNTFKKFPEFITKDPRSNRKETYTVTEDFMSKRLSCFFKDIDLKNKKILDLGCNAGAVGAWVLDSEADFYCGVEANLEVSEIAKENLTKNFNSNKWKIVNSFAEDFLKNCDYFDIIVASGIVYCFFDPIPIVKQISEKCDILILESLEPIINTTPAINNLLINNNFLENNALIVFRKQPVAWGQEKNVVFNGSKPSSGFFKHYLDILGFDVIDINQDLRAYLPDTYNKNQRFAFQFIKNQKKVTQSEGLYYGLLNNSPDIGFKEWNNSGNLTN